MKSKNMNDVWVVVEVFGGMTASAAVFTNEKSARRRELALRRKMRRDYDDVGVFRTKLRAGIKTSPPGRVPTRPYRR